MYKSYLRWFKPEGLLAAAGWAGAAEHNFNSFWHERFCIAVEPELVALIYPFLPELEEVRICSVDCTLSLLSALCLCHVDLKPAMWV